MSFDRLATVPQYSLLQEEKNQILLEELDALTEHHRERCPEYARLLAVTGFHRPAASMEAIPYLPVGLFKSHSLLSIPSREIFKTLTSSGTTGQQVSRIYLDRET